MIVWLHGAFSTCETFNYIRNKRQWGDELPINYDCSGDLLKVTQKISHFIASKTDEPVDIIGHSLGGVIGLALVKEGLPVRSIVTLSSPVGGIGGLWPPKTIGHEIKRLTKGLKYPTVHHQFYVSIDGHNPWFVLPNDGVVPISSQKFFPNGNYIEVRSNHFEILMNDDVIESISKFHYGLQEPVVS